MLADRYQRRTRYDGARMLRLLAITAIGFGLVASSGTLALQLAAGDWIRVEHPELPLSFEVPDGTRLQGANVFSLGQAVRNDQRRVDVPMYGVRTLDERRVVYHALHFGFFWLTDEIRGADAERLRGLGGQIGDPAVVQAFLRGVFYRRHEVDLYDAGRAAVGGYPARRVRIVWTVAPGTADERSVLGEAYLIPISETAALAIIARYDPAASERERTRLFPRIVRSIAIGPDSRDPSEQARARRRERALSQRIPECGGVLFSRLECAPASSSSTRSTGCSTSPITVASGPSASRKSERGRGFRPVTSSRSFSG